MRQILTLTPIAAVHRVSIRQQKVSKTRGLSMICHTVNALEADGRRQARFSTVRNQPASYVLKEVPVNPEFPTTLDLRTV
ncbi:MAG: transglutaminase family protein [Pseudomonadota bacterium]